MRLVHTSAILLFALEAAGVAFSQNPAPPQEVEIYAPNQNHVHLSWKDVATDETNYYVDHWNSGSQTWEAAGTLPPNSEVFRIADATMAPDISKYRVAAFKSGVDLQTLTWVEAEIAKPAGNIDLAPFTLTGDEDVGYERFDSFPEGFSAKAGEHFTHQVGVMGEGTPDSFFVRGVSSGATIAINATTGLVTGNASAPGVYRFFVGVNFDGDKTFEQVRYLRVVPDEEAPVVASPNFSVPAQNLGVEGVLPLGNLFLSSPAAAGQPLPDGATFETPAGFFTVALYEKATPKTVENFQNYVLDRQYDYTILHRAPAGFVIQAGSFYPSSNTVPTQWGQITNSNTVPVPNEPGISNDRGTIAMARLGPLRGNRRFEANFDTATSGWFVSTGGTNPMILDNQNGGFTAFGKVIGEGMEVVDDLQALQTGTYSMTIGGASATLADVPVRTNPKPASLGFDSIVYFPSVRLSPAVEISLVNNSNPSILTAEVVGMGLYLKSLNKIGSTSLTLRATNLKGLTADFTFPITIQDLSGPGVRLISIRGSRIPGALLVKGRAVDNNALRSYRYRVNGKRWFNGGRLSGKDTIFKKTMRGFKAGKNRLEIEVFDTKGQSSGILKQKFTLG